MKDLMLWILTGGAIPFFLLLCGGFFLIYLRGNPLRSPAGMLRGLKIPAVEGVSPFRAVTLALAGTLGVGNIVGVADAILIGGAGAVFWLWISALFAMLLKYAEILLAVKHRRMRRDGSFYGGAVCYIRDCFFDRKKIRLGNALVLFFSLLMILNALCTGCIIQVNAVSSALNGVFGLSAPLCGLLLLLIALPVMGKGTKGISALTEYFVPIMSCGYLILSLAAIWMRRGDLLSALSRIFTEAFTPKSALGGATGFLTSQALRAGTMRGLLSNEGGCGTAPTAHASSHTPFPAAQGVWGILEVFVDTILLCTVTALVILMGLPELHDFGLSPVMTTVYAYSAILGDWAKFFFAAAILCFGYATVICWASYGMESVKAITGKRGYLLLYLAAFALCIPMGSIVSPDAVWNFSDFAIAAMTTVNLTVLILMRREIRAETLLFFNRETPPASAHCRKTTKVDKKPKT